MNFRKCVLSCERNGSRHSLDDDGLGKPHVEQPRHGNASVVASQHHDSPTTAIDGACFLQAQLLISESTV
jgi:hypothetical protein